MRSESAPAHVPELPPPAVAPPDPLAGPPPLAAPPVPDVPPEAACPPLPGTLAPPEAALPPLPTPPPDPAPLPPAPCPPVPTAPPPVPLIPPEPTPPMPPDEVQAPARAGTKNASRISRVRIAGGVTDRRSDGSPLYPGLGPGVVDARRSRQLYPPRMSLPNASWPVAAAPVSRPGRRSAQSARVPAPGGLASPSRGRRQIPGGPVGGGSSPPRVMARS